MNHFTSCPLDCYDACEVSFTNNIIQAVKEGHTSGFLCPHLNHYTEYETITSARYKDKDITLDNALIILKKIIKDSKKEELLHYKGNGNFSLMQDVTEHFFASYGATLTDGTLCDGAGEAGIIHGRGSNKNMPLSEIEKSEVVVIWGRNPHSTSSHLLPLLKDKKIIVIDPIKTKIANSADLFIQIRPHGDLRFAMLAYRILEESSFLNKNYLKNHTNNHENYFNLTKTLPLEDTLKNIDVSLADIKKFVKLIKNKKVAIVCGLGIQKYSDGADSIRAIDALAVGLGLFGKEGCGVAYLGNSKEMITSPFSLKASRVSKVDTEFDSFKTVVIQGANPASQMPNSSRVVESLASVQNLVYFGLYENETSAIADLIIPAKTFLSKNDIRTSYSHHGMMNMLRVKETLTGISEYDLSSYLCDTFDIELKSEAYYLEHFKSFSVEQSTGMLKVELRKDIPYIDGFDTENKKFIFLQKIKNNFYMKDDLFLITPKSSKSLNSQFKREKHVYINASHGFIDGDELMVSSSVGSVKLSAKINPNLRNDCVLIYSGTPGVNNLTTSKHSEHGKCAIYQQEKITLCKS